MKVPRRLIASVLGTAALFGCVATKYQMAPKGTLPAVMLALETAQPPVELALRMVIVYNGPGSWKRDALWDEYVVAIRNQGATPVTIDAVSLVDLAGDSSIPGNDPWKLEKESQTLEQRYLRAGVAFARSEIPDALVFGASAIGGAAGTAFSAASATAASASVIGLPVYYIIVFGVDHSNKAVVQKEFTRRRLVLPLTLAGGAMQSGSLFFTMTPDPQSMNLHWRADSSGQQLALSLASLHGLHIAAPVTAQAPAPP